MTWDRKAPFNESGDLLHYPGYPVKPESIEWRLVEEFEATLHYDSFTRGRSAAYVFLRDREHWCLYPMFLAELDIALHYFHYGSVRGIWTVTKRGQNFGVKLVRGRPSLRDAAHTKLLAAARRECAQFKFPDEDRPGLWEAIQEIEDVGIREDADAG